MEKRNVLIIGGILVLTGIVLLAAQVTGWHFDWGQIWPLILIVVGCSFLFRIDKDKGVIFPAIILIGIGKLFFITQTQMFGPGLNTGNLWPFFIIIPGLAFVGLWLTNVKNYGVLVPAAACLITGSVFLGTEFSGASFVTFIVPAVVVLIGIVIIAQVFIKKPDQLSNPPDDKENR
ncbi:MAG: hypothetical protein GX421_01335 [Caldisericales bacterium]|nr:hypothetical protein [Caldisericales bacterium]